MRGQVNDALIREALKQEGRRYSEGPTKITTSLRNAASASNNSFSSPRGASAPNSCSSKSTTSSGVSSGSSGGRSCEMSSVGGVYGFSSSASSDGLSSPGSSSN